MLKLCGSYLIVSNYFLAKTERSSSFQIRTVSLVCSGEDRCCSDCNCRVTALFILYRAMTTDHAWYLSRNQYQPLIILSSSDKRSGAINYMYLTNLMILFITTYSDWMTNSGVLWQYLCMLHNNEAQKKFCVQKIQPQLILYSKIKDNWISSQTAIAKLFLNHFGAKTDKW